MIFNRRSRSLRLFAVSLLFLTSFSVVLYPGQTIKAQSAACNFNSASLNPNNVFGASFNNYLSNTLNVSGVSQTNLTVNSANLLQNAQIEFSLFPAAAGIFFNLNLGQNFPPNGTANLPRPAFDPLNVPVFYVRANNLNASQLQAVQNVYAQDLVSRRNYATNIANLARHFTALQNAGANQVITGFALNALRNAYNTLSTPTNPAPNPRQLYRQVSIAFIELLNLNISGTFNDPATVSQDQLVRDAQTATIALRSLDPRSVVCGIETRIGLNILGIGLANYDANRLPVLGGNNAPTPSTVPAGTFPLVAFNTARNQPLSAAQSNPAGVFGAQVVSYLRRFGLSVTAATPLDYQVNSADQLQTVYVPLGVLPGRQGIYDGRFAILFKGGVIPSATATAAASIPEFALPVIQFNLDSGAQFTSTAANTAARRTALRNFYNDPANVARRNNYIANLNNLKCALTQIQQTGENTPAIQQAISSVNGALQTLANGNAPDVLGVYKSVGNYILDSNSVNETFGGAAINTYRTLSGSLLPIGLINYYLVPITAAGIS